MPALLLPAAEIRIFFGSRSASASSVTQASVAEPPATVEEMAVAADPALARTGAATHGAVAHRCQKAPGSHLPFTIPRDFDGYLSFVIETLIQTEATSVSHDHPFPLETR